MAGVKLIVFDMDGTLIDSLASIKASMSTAFETVGREVPDPKAISRIVGLSLPQAIDRLCPGLDDVALDALVAAYKSSFKSRAEGGNGDGSALYQGAREALERLAARDGVSLGIATGKSRRGLDRVLDEQGLSQFFVTTQAADDHPSKPHPSMLYQTLEDTGAEARDAIMVGDTSFDMEMGQAAGFATLAVDWGYHPREMLEPLATGLIEDFSQIDEAVNAIWAGQ